MGPSFKEILITFLSKFDNVMLLFCEDNVSLIEWLVEWSKNILFSNLFSISPQLQFNSTAIITDPLACDGDLVDDFVSHN